MSRVNIKYELVDNQSEVAEYSARSPDFGMGAWEEIARIRFDKSKRTYAFVPKGALASAEIVPPHVYGLPDEERERELRERYSKARYGGWTGFIHRWATQVLAASTWEHDAVTTGRR